MRATGAEQLELVEPLLPEAHAGERAVELEVRAVLAAPGGAAGDHAAEQAALEAEQAVRDVLVLDPRASRRLLDPAELQVAPRWGHRPLGHHHRRVAQHLGDRPGQVAGEADRVAAQVAQGPAAGLGALAAPGERHGRVGHVVLLERAAQIGEPAELAVVQELLDVPDRRHAQSNT